MIVRCRFLNATQTRPGAPDELQVSQKEPGKFEVPQWDAAGRKKVRDALIVLPSTVPDAKRTFGPKAEVDPDAAGSIQRRCAALACGKTGTCFLGAGCTQVAVAKPEAVGALRVDGTYVVAEDYPTVEGVDGGR